MKGTEFKQYTIDASGKILGRLATEVALLLRGKNKAEFVPYREANVKIIVVNVEKIKVSGKKDNCIQDYRKKDNNQSCKKISL